MKILIKIFLAFIIGVFFLMSVLTFKHYTANQIKDEYKASMVNDTIGVKDDSISIDTAIIVNKKWD